LHSPFLRTVTICFYPFPLLVSHAGALVSDCCPFVCFFFFAFRLHFKALPCPFWYSHLRRPAHWIFQQDILLEADPFPPPPSFSCGIFAFVISPFSLLLYVLVSVILSVLAYFPLALRALRTLLIIFGFVLMVPLTFICFFLRPALMRGSRAFLPRGAS